MRDQGLINRKAGKNERQTEMVSSFKFPISAKAPSLAKYADDWLCRKLKLET
jgi:hypothetical protein